MRLSVLDKVICPRCQHFPLRVESAAESPAPVPVMEGIPCQVYCARLEQTLPQATDLPCAQCLAQRVLTGLLTCPQCQGRYSIENGILNLLLEETSRGWVAEEKDWWETHYKHRVSSARIEPYVTSPTDLWGVRNYERQHYLFTSLRQRGLRGKNVIEIGAGTSIYVARLLHPAVEGYFYLSTDVSRAALAQGLHHLPEGDFVQAAAPLPFRPASFAIGLCLGVLHHLPEWAINLRHFLELLQPGAWALFDECIEKPRILGRFRQQSLTAAFDSPHEGDIKEAEFQYVLNEQGRIILWRTKSTPVRFALLFLFRRWTERSLILTRFVLGLDRVFQNIFGRWHRSLGPGEVLVIFENHT